MKQGKLHWVFTITVALMLLLANRSHALFTSYLIDASNQLSAFRATLPTDTPAERRTNAAITRALADLSKPSTNVVTDYNIFVTAALHLSALFDNETISQIGSYVFNAFTNDAQALINTAGARVAALSDLNGQKRPASNAVVAAQTTLNRLSSIDPKLQLILARQVFAKIVVANRLAAIAEVHPVYAPRSVIGRTLHHDEGANGSGMVHFDTATTATDTDNGGTPRTSRYSYRKTGLTTATLTLREPQDSGGTSTTTVQLTFTSVGGGTFTFHHVDGDGTTDDGTGTFTLD